MTSPSKQEFLLSNNATTLPTGSRSELRDIVSSQLKILLGHKNYHGAQALLIPVQPVDIAEAVRQSLALRAPRTRSASKTSGSPQARLRRPLGDRVSVIDSYFHDF